MFENSIERNQDLNFLKQKIKPTFAIKNRKKSIN